MLDRCSSRQHHAKAALLTNRNVVEAKRDPVASGPLTTKPYPTDSTIDDALVQRKFTTLIRGDL